MSSAPSKVSRTEVESVRSAEPLIIHGTSAAIAFCTWFEALRVASPFGSASNDGMSRSQPSGSSRRWMAPIWPSSVACSRR